MGYRKKYLQGDREGEVVKEMFTEREREGGVREIFTKREEERREK